MIERTAVLHIPLSEYAFTNSETSLTIRLRAARGNLADCTLYYGDRVQPSDPIAFAPLSMQRVAEDLYFDYFEVTFDSPYSRVCYYFSLTDGEENLYLYAGLLEPELPQERSEFYQYPFLRREEVSDVPGWFKRAVVYNIFPDSFATGRRFLRTAVGALAMPDGRILRSRLGGTIRGITENLDYIADLGFNCLYLNPIFTAEEYHKYDLLDYFHVSPNLGTDSDFHELVDAAHSRGMRVIIDGVFNHCSWYFFAFDDVVRNGETSPYRDWFYDLKFPVVRPEEGVAPEYASFAYEPKMPKLNSSNPEVRSYFMRVCSHWLKEFDVDGWRLDVANEVDKEFWRAFRRTARRVKPESVMIGEIWESAERWLQGDMFDSAMNYDFRKNCRDFFALGRLNAQQFNARVTQMLLRYPTGIVQGQLNLLDSHDVNRFLYLCGGDLERFRLAMLFLFCMPGVPSVFYGDELGIAGGDEFSLRGPMPWDAPHADERLFFRQLTALRKMDATTLGAFRVREMHGSLYVFERTYGQSVLVVALNADNTPMRMKSDVPPLPLQLSFRFADGCLGERGYAVWFA